MSVGDKPAFPPMHDPELQTFPCFLGDDSGMTYRQWMIGMIACGYQAAIELAIPRDTEFIIGRADAIIAALDAEQQKGGEN